MVAFRITRRDHYLLEIGERAINILCLFQGHAFSMRLLNPLISCQVHQVQLAMDDFLAGLDGRSTLQVDGEDGVGARRGLVLVVVGSGAVLLPLK